MRRDDWSGRPSGLARILLGEQHVSRVSKEAVTGVVGYQMDEGVCLVGAKSHFKVRCGTA